MTNDHDDLLSAYIDGLATPDEVATVEGDPELRARAAALRAMAIEMAEAPPPPATLRARHLGAALEAFDQLGLASAGASAGAGAADADAQSVEPSSPNRDATAGAPVVDLGDKRRSIRRSATRPSRQAGIPSWLGAAAALLLVVGGIGWIASRTGGGDDSDSASADFETSATAPAGDAADEGEITEQSSLVAADEAAETQSAEADRAAGGNDDAALEEAREGATDESGAAAAADGDRGFFGEEIEQARIAFAEPPTQAEVDDLLVGERFPAEFSLCGAEVDLALEAEAVGFVPISIAEQPGEVLVFLRGDGSEVALVVDQACATIG